MEHFGTPAALLTPVEEPPLGNPVVAFQFRGMIEQCPVPGKELRVSPAPFIHQFPERAVSDCLAYPGDLGKGDMEVVECQEALAIGSCAEFLGGMGTGRLRRRRVDRLVR